MSSWRSGTAQQGRHGTLPGITKEKVMKLTDNSVLITGGGPGIGRAPAEELIVSTVNTNLVGTIQLTGASIENPSKQESAAIIIVSSVLGFTPMAMKAVHSAAKAAIHSYAQPLRFKLRNTSVRVLEVIPPWVRTALLRGQAGPHESFFVHSFNEEPGKVPA
jgi:short-subunit dehydrogenase involved in D-alanine esterification of teichoic acids